MRELWQFTKLIRSKNAGPFELTFDIMFKNRDSFNDVLKSEALSPNVIAQLYRVDVKQVKFFVIEQLLPIRGHRRNIEPRTPAHAAIAAGSAPHARKIVRIER